MGTYKALAPIFIVAENKTYKPGEAVELDDDKAVEFAALGVIEIGTDTAPNTTTQPAKGDLTALYNGMTKAQLVDVAKVEGIEVPKGATKAQIIELLKDK